MEFSNTKSSVKRNKSYLHCQNMDLVSYPNRKLIIKLFNRYRIYIYHTEDRVDMKAVLLKIMLPSYLLKHIN